MLKRAEVVDRQRVARAGRGAERAWHGVGRSSRTERRSGRLIVTGVGFWIGPIERGMRVVRPQLDGFGGQN